MKIYKIIILLNLITDCKKKRENGYTSGNVAVSDR
jgi:hypothetical protein